MDSSLANSDIYNIHCFLEKRLGRNSEKSKPYNSFLNSDLTPENILTDILVKERFVFIKANSFVEYKYNLIAFEMVGGDYTFKTYGQIHNYVINEKGEKVPLPEKVDNFNLYSGEVKTNEVKVKLTGQKYNRHYMQ